MEVTTPLISYFGSLSEKCYKRAAANKRLAFGFYRIQPDETKLSQGRKNQTVTAFIRFV